jgi:GTPase SAR1 family protein
MTEATALNQQAGAVRQQMISILENLAKKASEFELPKPPEALERYHQRLVENTYKVLVAGEAKRGKSKFINALIGQDILPTNVRVTTSQVFDVRLAERDAYRLRFEDNSEREITLDDLPRYGSQVLEDAGERPELDQIIRWIEVDTPTIRFLPDGVSLLDTPGLGALYAAHAQITQRFVPEADAVIFVLDSEKPIVRSEIEFIETILSETSDIFFIQTKIDLYDEEHWQHIQRRNQEILDESFKDRLTDTSVWPISSTLLLAAAAGGEDAEEDLEDSRHKELETALRAFLFRVAGWRRSAEAILVADSYHTTSHMTLSGRLANLTEDAAKRTEMQRRAAERKEQFEREWGEQGQKRRELYEEIKRRIHVSRRRFDDALRFDGAVGQALQVKIEGLRSLEEARELNEVMGEEVKAAAGEQWRRRCREAEAGCVELLVPLLAAADVVINTPQSADTPALTAKSTVVADLEKSLFKGSLWERIENAREEAVKGFVLGGLGGAIVGTITGPLEPVVMVVGAIVGGLWGLRTGWKEVELSELKKAKATLKENLTTLIEPVRQQFFSEPDTSFRSSPVDEYFNGLDRAMDEQIQAIVKQKLEEVEAEHARLDRSGDLNDQQRKDSIERTKRQLVEWEAIGKAIENVSARLNALNQPTAVIHQRQDNSM